MLRPPTDEPTPTASRRPSGESAGPVKTPTQLESIACGTPPGLTRIITLSDDPAPPLMYTIVPDGDQASCGNEPPPTSTPSSTGTDEPVTSSFPRSNGATSATPSRRTYSR